LASGNDLGDEGIITVARGAFEQDKATCLFATMPCPRCPLRFHSVGGKIFGRRPGVSAARP